MLHDPALAIGDLFAHLHLGSALPAESRELLVVAILRVIRKGERFDTAIGLSAAGVRTLRTRLLTLQRDTALLAALAAVALDEDVSDWERCRRLSKDLRRFVAVAQPMSTRMSAPLADWPEWKKAVFVAMQTGLDLPTSPRRLLDIAQRKGECSSRDFGVMLLARYL